MILNLPIITWIMRAPRSVHIFIHFLISVDLISSSHFWFVRFRNIYNGGQKFRPDFAPQISPGSASLPGDIWQLNKSCLSLSLVSSNLVVMWPGSIGTPEEADPHCFLAVFLVFEFSRKKHDKWNFTKCPLLSIVVSYLNPRQLLCR